ncbi:MAG: SDR family NAD(P)-dependent oxidoreductase [Sphingomonadales bacterium]|nr:SDR family NAD(P)-dependent oxidoreductase [Sphingomonadales bacterium]MBD3774085.1 SDR family NAD(P)-dependent oxidoreductase [Paracoccaceae bacterium]
MIIVTGAAGILGQAVVRRLAQDGLAVAALDLATEIPDGGQARALGGIDLTDAAAVAQAVAQVAQDGALAGLVNVAGGFVWETLGEGDPATYDKMFRINVQTAANACAAALPALREARGAVVNVAAAATLKAGAGMGAYAASKAGVMKLTEALAAEELDSGVRVNAVMPSIIDTPANRKDMPDADFGKWVSPDALAGVVAFLLSADAAPVTGACLPVTGGVAW